jgi:hypothetical protein
MVRQNRDWGTWWKLIKDTEEINKCGDSGESWNHSSRPSTTETYECLSAMPGQCARPQGNWEEKEGHTQCPHGTLWLMLTMTFILQQQETKFLATSTAHLRPDHHNRGITIPNFKLYFRVIVIKTPWAGHWLLTPVILAILRKQRSRGS